MASQDSRLHSTTSKKTRRRFIQATGATAALGLAGCMQQTDDGDNGGGDGNENSSDDGTDASSVDSVTVGVLVPLSGPFSQLGEASEEAAQIAVDYVNDSDELDFELEAVYEDTQTDPSTGRQKAQKLVQDDDVDYLAGCINSSVALAVADYVGQQGIPYVSGAAAMEVTGENCNQYTFRNETNTAMQAAGLVNYAVDELGTDWWIHTADYAYGNSAIEQIEQRIEDEGHDVTIHGRSTPEQGTDDFGPYISQISDSDAEVLAIPLTGGDLINFMRQANNAGLKDDVEIIGTAIFAQTIRGGLGPAAYGTYSSTLYNAGLEVGDNQQFVEAYQSEYDSPPGHFARVGYDAVRMPAWAIQEAGSADPDEIANTLPGLEMTTALGETSFRECDHQSLNTVWTSALNEPEEGELAAVEILNEVAAEDAIPDCSATNCEM